MQVVHDNYHSILLKEIRSNPRNPRKNFSGPKFNELVASIREKGVQTPIIVRSSQVEKTKYKYEVVAGDRRLKACEFIAEEDGEVKTIHNSIPAIIRPYTDDEAYECMLIENLQREDLTAFEEAWAFKLYIELKGEGAVLDIAKKLGKSAGYLRRKVAVLKLPAKILKSWEEDVLSFSHLEQLRRLKNPAEMENAFKFATGTLHVHRDPEPVSKRDLKEHIDEMAPDLDQALFDIDAAGCLLCTQNSHIQHQLWEIQKMKGAHCLDRACFKKNTNIYLLKHWEDTPFREKYKTNGFRLEEGVAYNDFNHFSTSRTWGIMPAAKCKACKDFLTILRLDGTVEEAKACFGKESCFNDITKERAKSSRDNARGENEVPDGPRVIAWHGEHFREEFLKKRLPAVYNKLAPFDLRIARLGLFAFISLDRNIRESFKRQIKLKTHFDKGLVERIEKMELPEIQERIMQCAIEVIMGYSVSSGGRLAAAAHLGINLKKEFAVTKEYLEKKTIREMIDFGEAFKIFKDKKVVDYLEKTLKRKKVSSCKKKELVALFLKSGVDLVGKVPAEILEVK